MRRQPYWGEVAGVGGPLFLRVSVLIWCWKEWWALRTESSHIRFGFVSFVLALMWSNPYRASKLSNCDRYNVTDFFQHDETVFEQTLSRYEPVLMMLIKLRCSRSSDNHFDDAN